MSGHLTVRGWVYTAVLVVAPFAALALGDPSPALAALPAAAFVVFGLAARPRSDPGLTVSVHRSRTLERIPIELRLTVRGEGREARVSLDLPRQVEIVEVVGARRTGESTLVVPLVEGEGEATLTVAAHHWGNYRLAGAWVTVPGPMHVVSPAQRVEPTENLVVLPEIEKVRLLVEPLATNLHTGELSSAARGPGWDLAGLRSWTRGDSPRAINWRATARSDEVWVTDRHADRNGDLVIVIDSVGAPGSAMEGALAAAVRIIASLVKAYGVTRHRLGLISFGGFNRWFGLDSGAVHEHRLLEAVMTTQATTEPVWLAVDRVLDRSVRPPSMVVFVSPLLEDALVGRILRLARAGIDVITIVMDGSVWLRPSADRVQAQASRIWLMERQRTVDRLRGAGVGVGEWRPGRPLDELLEEVQEWRRRSRRARA